MKTAYLSHILLWMAPMLFLQWTVGARILRNNLRAILFPSAAAAIYLTLVDSLAIRSGIWCFDTHQILGPTIGPWVPIEEALFFILTALLVSQSLVLLLPSRFRYEKTSSPTRQKS